MCFGWSCGLGLSFRRSSLILMPDNCCACELGGRPGCPLSLAASSEATIETDPKLGSTLYGYAGGIKLKGKRLVSYAMATDLSD